MNVETPSHVSVSVQIQARLQWSHVHMNVETRSYFK